MGASLPDRPFSAPSSPHPRSHPRIRTRAAKTFSRHALPLKIQEKLQPYRVSLPPLPRLRVACAFRACKVRNRKGRIKMPRTTTRTRTRRANPPQREALLSFCRHCESVFEPASSPIPDVCPNCVETRYTQCDRCGSYHLTEEMLTTSEPHIFCQSCAESLTYTCGFCGQRHETEFHQSTTAHDGRLICDECLSSFSRCNCCGRLFRNSDTQLTSNGRYCWSCSAYNTG